MSDEDEHPDRRSASEDGLAPAVSRRLRRLLAEVPTIFPCLYACLIHPRRRAGEQGFGVITLSGESLPLSVAMLATLRKVPTLLEGRAPVVVGPAEAKDSLIQAADGHWSVPLPVAQLTMRLLPMDDSDEETAEPEGTDQVVTPSNDGPQITLLCATRPGGWPG